MTSRLMRQVNSSEYDLQQDTKGLSIYPLVMSSFSPEVHEKILKFIESHEVKTGEKNSARKVAVFDADGTLWRGDVGESFLKFQIKKSWIKHTWNEYWDEVVAGDPLKAYANIVKWYTGMPEAELEKQIREFLHDGWKNQVFEPMRLLTHALMNAGFEVWVVSASPYWVVREATRGFGIQPDRVIGFAAEVDMKGCLTDKLIQPLPYRAGKAEAIKKRIGVMPLFAAGNTRWDQEMLALSTELCLAVSSEKKGEPNFESEQELLKMAQAKKWLVQEF